MHSSIARGEFFMGAPIRILIADDSELFRKSLCKLLFAEGPVEVCGQAGDYAELLKKLTDTSPDVVLMDIWMPYSGDVRVDTIKAELSGSCLIAMSFSVDDETAEVAKNFGAHALLDKSTLATSLLPAIDECLRQKRSALA
jgi:DNA-binding NarL/FixJ family response regulator